MDTLCHSTGSDFVWWRLGPCSSIYHLHVAFLCSQQMSEFYWLAQHLLQVQVLTLQRQLSGCETNNKKCLLGFFFLFFKFVFFYWEFKCLQNLTFKSWEIRQFCLLVTYHLSISGLCAEVLFLFIYIYIMVFATGLLSHSVYIVTEISEWEAIHVFCYSYWPICDPHVVFTFNHYIEFKTINFSIGFLSIVAIINIWMPHKP